MSHKEYVKINNPLIKPLFKFKLTILLSNWVFQGMLYADKAERRFKILLDIIVSAVLYVLLINYVQDILSTLLIAFFTAHTFNWLFNGQIFVLARYFGIKPNKHGEFSVYLERLKERAKTEKSIKLVFVYGSKSRNELNEYSDIDVRIVRDRGVANAIKACMFGFRERAMALFNRFPLDLYVIDSTDHLSKMRKDEIPIILYDSTKL